MRRALLLVLLGAGCGGSQAAAPPPSTAAPAPEGPTTLGEDPDAYAAVSAYFARKRPHVSQCYANARQNGQLDDKARGFVAVSLTVLPSGQPQDVKVARTTLNNAAVEDCITALVAKWVLPQPTQAIAFSYTYDFKPE